MDKRIVDLLLALLLAPFALVLCSLASIAIRVETSGPALFRQTRVGQSRQPFTLYKLRTMSVGTGDHASHEVSATQVTRVGQCLRRTKLDELPQLINVLKGDMSFVGPRPCLPNQTELIAERAARNVFDIRPGITGPAQIAKLDMSTPEKLAEVDAAYIQTRSFSSDLKLLWATALGSGRGDAVKWG